MALPQSTPLPRASQAFARSVGPVNLRCIRGHKARITAGNSAPRGAKTQKPPLLWGELSSASENPGFLLKASSLYCLLSPCLFAADLMDRLLWWSAGRETWLNQLSVQP